MNIIITILAILLVSYLLMKLARKINLPVVVALIVGGLILSSPIFKGSLLDPNTGVLLILGNIGLICLMFLAGLESSWKYLNKEKKNAVIIALFAALIPFLLGFTAFMLFGFSLLVSLIVGISMSITAEATKAKVLLDLKKIKTKVGSVMMGAGIIDDIIGLTLFIIVAYTLGNAPFKETGLVALAIIAFFTGIIIQKNFGREHRVMKTAERLLLLLIVPFFFIAIGLHFNFQYLFFFHPLIIIVILIALIGKIGGTLITKPFTSFSFKQLYLVGWGMNSRGAIELALALVAFKSGFIPSEIYSTLIIMALTTTLIFPFIITKMIKKNPKIMN